MKELLGVFAAFLMILIFLYFIDKKSCEVKSKSFQDHEYSLVGGCMVNHKGSWLPLDNIRGFD